MPSKNKGGRPLKFQSVEKLEAKIEEYKRYVKDNRKPPTYAGLAYFLGIDRKTLFNYSDKKSKFFPTIKKARAWIAMFWEEILMIQGKPGQIFMAKNYGYRDIFEHQAPTETSVPKIKITVKQSRKRPDAT